MTRRSLYHNALTDCLSALGVIGADPRHVEAWIRVQHSTLDGLTNRQLLAEVALAANCIERAGNERSEALAVSYGL